ncbi:hypothetical protein K438DRAFT_1816842 [Mycena galopus ATCC 62051]|nr:hypothetical protein K438DRAFT_1816842 [Mycena galopus ATCC 62051]
MSKRNLSELPGGDVHAERPSTKQRQLIRPQQPPPFSSHPNHLLSYTPAHELEFTDSALRFLAAPPPRAQLAHGYDRWVRRPEMRPRIDGLLCALSAARAKRHPALANGVGAVGWRGVLTRILTAPYEEREGWEMNVMCVDGVLYFEEHRDEAKLREKNDIAPRQRLQTYFGYSFESYCTSEKASASKAPSVNVPQAPGDPLGWGGDVDTNVQWCSVVRTKLGDTRLVIGGEVDCVRGKYTGQTNTFVELKTSMVIRGPQDEARFEKCEILVGFRTPGGEVTTLQTFRTVEIPRLVRGKAHGWEPAKCLAFLKTHVRSQKQKQPEQEDADREEPEQDLWGEGEGSEGDADGARGHPDAAVWRVTFRPGVGVELRRLDDVAVRDVESEEVEEDWKSDKEKVERVGFLPRWYWEEITADANGEST